MRPCGHVGHEARARGARRRGGAAVRGVDGEENRRVERSGDGSEQGSGDGGERVGVERSDDGGGDGSEHGGVDCNGDGGVQGGEDGGEQVGVEHRVSGRIDSGAIARAPWAVTARAPQADAAPLSAADAHVSRAVRSVRRCMCDTRMAYGARVQGVRTFISCTGIHCAFALAQACAGAVQSTGSTRGTSPHPCRQWRAANVGASRGTSATTRALHRGLAGHIPAPLQADGLPASRMREMRRRTGGRSFHGWA